MTEAEFLQFFEQFGEVIDSVVMIDRVTKRSRGFGFVTFAKEVSSPTKLVFSYYAYQPKQHSNSQTGLPLSISYS